ncbi:hypothetical protein ACFHWW_18655 [Ensifer sp. P24N7]|uniref:hypothetical protein n=1 Tax=Sinorhizobium sp. P24N7 TaxID=3348358 RepID=UPI0035F3F983
MPASTITGAALATMAGPSPRQDRGPRADWPEERLVSSEAVAEAVRAYAEEMNRLNRDRRVQATTDQKALAQIEKAIAGIIAAIEGRACTSHP